MRDGPGYSLFMNGARNAPEEETQMNAKISAAILMNMAKGMDQKAAIDAVLGAGSYEKLVGALYDGLRAKASTK